LRFHDLVSRVAVRDEARIVNASSTFGSCKDVVVVYYRVKQQHARQAACSCRLEVVV
jgi:hypothetical protein